MFNGIIQKIKEDFVMPLVRRASSNASTALATYGATSDQVETFEAVIIIALGVLVDLIFSKINAKTVLSSWGKN